MTTIVYRDGLMVADSMAWFGRHNPSPGSKVKLWRSPEGVLSGVTSSAVGADSAVKHYLEFDCWPGDGVCPEEYGILRVRPDGQAFVAMNSMSFSGPISAPYFAIGSGVDAAMGALFMGANPWQAVAVACQFDKHSAPPLYGMMHGAPGLIRLNDENSCDRRSEC